MKALALLIFTLFATSAFAVNPTLNLTNNFGEQSVNQVTGGNFVGVPIATHTVLANLTSGTAVPTAATYAALSAVLLPTQLLTGYVSGAGTVAAADTVLAGIQKLNGNAVALQAQGIIPGTAQALAATGAVSVSVMETTVTNAGSTYAVTLAAPSGIDGQIKIIKAITAMAGTVTLAMTNVAIGGGYTARGTTTLTFTSIGDSAVFIAVGAKWVYLGGSAVAS